MAKSSFNIIKALPGGLKHGDRTESIEPKYLLPVEFREENEIDISAIDAQKKINSLVKKAKMNHLKTFGQKLQAKSFLQEGVINLNRNHTLKDVQKLIKRLEKETGFTSIQIAIHRDEGYIEEDEDGRKSAVYNYHAHLTFFTLNLKTGQQLYRRDISKNVRNKYRKEIEAQFALRPAANIIKPLREVKKKKQKIWHINDPATNKEIMRRFMSDGYIVYNRLRMSYLQTIVAEELKMERGTVSVKEEADRLGVNVNPNPNVRQGHKQYRATANKLEALKKKNLKLEKDLEEANKHIKSENEINDVLKKDLSAANQKLPSENEIIVSRKLFDEVIKLKEKFEIAQDEDIFDEIKKQLEVKNSNDELQETLAQKIKEIHTLSDNLPKAYDVVISKELSEEIQRLKKEFKHETDLGLYDAIVTSTKNTQARMDELTTKVEDAIAEKNQLLEANKKREEEEEETEMYREWIFKGMNDDSRSSSANNFEEFINIKKAAGINIEEDRREIHYDSYVFHFSDNDLQSWKNNISTYRKEMIEAEKEWKEDSQKMVNRVILEESTIAKDIDDLLKRVNKRIDGEISYENGNIDYKVEAMSWSWSVSEKDEKNIWAKFNENNEIDEKDHDLEFQKSKTDTDKIVSIVNDEKDSSNETLNGMGLKR